MKPEISRKAALIIHDIPFENRAAFIDAIEKAETIFDLPEPYRGWIEGKSKPKVI